MRAKVLLRFDTILLVLMAKHPGGATLTDLVTDFHDQGLVVDTGSIARAVDRLIVDGHVEPARKPRVTARVYHRTLSGKAEAISRLSRLSSLLDTEIPIHDHA